MVSSSSASASHIWFAVIPTDELIGTDNSEPIVAETFCSKDGEKAIVVQCANFQRLTFAKVRTDLTKLRVGGESAGAHFSLIAGGAVSGTLKTRILDAAKSAGFTSADVMSGTEFEEAVRVLAPELLRRFVDGASFPELGAEIRAFAQEATDLTDDQIIGALALAFDRPAFRTHFHQESSLPRFKDAIGETIRTLNTGETPEGARIPSRHSVNDPAKRELLDRLVGLLVSLRAAFDGAIRAGTVRPCGCKQPDCPIFFFEDSTTLELDRRRAEILTLVASLDARFHAHFY